MSERVNKNPFAKWSHVNRRVCLITFVRGSVLCRNEMSRVPTEKYLASTFHHEKIVPTISHTRNLLV